MSGIFGIINFDRSPVQAHLLQQMMGSIAYWGETNRYEMVDNGGVGVLHRPNTPEDSDAPPLIKNANLIFTAAARLDNRDELCNLFEIPFRDRPATSDTDLIYLAYQKWGDQAPDQLLGDWCFAVWDAAQQTLFLARDHHGQTALFYAQQGNRFLFASSRKALLALGVPRRLDELYLAQVLVSWPDYHGAQSIDRDILRLPPAHALRITAEGTNIWRYWRLEETPLLHLPSFDEYVQGFLEVYGEAVRSRLRSRRPLATTLSGGLDSGSVTALAAQELLARGQSLTALTAIPTHDSRSVTPSSRFGDERSFASLTAAAYPNINHQLITADHVTPLDGIYAMQAIQNEPGHAASNYFWIIALMQAAQAAGIGTLLTGQGGNATISWTGNRVARRLRGQLRQRNWPALTRALLPDPLVMRLRLRRARRQSWDHTAIRPAFAQRLNLAQQRVRAEHGSWRTPYRQWDPRQQRLEVIMPGRSFVGEYWNQLGAAFGLDVRDPTFDKRVLSYTLSIPDRWFSGPNGEDRWLIRTAMNGLLPDPVRLNRRRGKQGADVVFRVANQLERVEAVLRQLKQSQRSAPFVDLEKIEEVLQQASRHPSPMMSHRMDTIVLRGLDAALFLETHPEQEGIGSQSAVLSPMLAR